MKTKNSPAVQKIIDAARAGRDERGAYWIKTKDVAVLIRDQLKKNFPGVKFGVTSDSNCVDVRWNDGPATKEIDSIIRAYKFGGFDGSIDMAYSGSNWLLLDGSMTMASVEGTAGSLGCVSAQQSDCPAPGAVLIKGGPRYVFSHREISDERYSLLAGEAAIRLGIDLEKNIHNQRLDNGQYLVNYLMHEENDLLADAANRAANNGVLTYELTTADLID